MSLSVFRKTVVALLMLFALAGFGGCSSSEPETKVVGGAVQGKALQLAGIASTYAGFSAETRTQFDRATAIVVDGAYLYVGDGTAILKITIATGEVATLAGSRDASGYDDGIGAGARFTGIAAMTSNGADLYVVDGCAIRKVTKAIGAVTTVAGRGAEPGSKDGAAADARFSWPAGITSDGANLYIADAGNDTIRRLELGTGEVTTIAGTPGIYEHVDGTGSAARFSGLAAITVLGGNLYVSDYQYIRKIQIAEGAVTTVADIKWDLFGLTNDGRYLYVSQRRSILRVDPATGDITNLAGTEGSGRMLLDGTGEEARFQSPAALSSDGANLYVADSVSRSVRKVVIATGAVTTLVRGKASMGWADGPAASARFAMPGGVTTDGASLFVADSNTIRKVTIATGEVRTLAGAPSSYFGGITDGAGGAANINSASAITYDGKNLYVVDADDDIRRVTPDKGDVVTVKIGIGVIEGITNDGKNLYLSMPYQRAIWKLAIATGAVTVLAEDGSGVGAELGSPTGITTDGTSLYAVDKDSGSIKKIDLATGYVSVFFADPRYEARSQGITTDGTSVYFGVNGKIAKVAIATGAITAFVNDGPMPTGLTTDGNMLYMVSPDNTVKVMR